MAHIESKTIQSVNILENKLYIYIYIIKILKYFPSKQFFLKKLINGFEIPSLFISLAILGLSFFFLFFL